MKEVCIRIKNTSMNTRRRGWGEEDKKYWQTGARPTNHLLYMQNTVQVLCSNSILYQNSIYYYYCYYYLSCVKVKMFIAKFKTYKLVSLKCTHNTYIYIYIYIYIPIPPIANVDKMTKMFPIFYPSALSQYSFHSGLFWYNFTITPLYHLS